MSKGINKTLSSNLDLAKETLNTCKFYSTFNIQCEKFLYLWQFWVLPFITTAPTFHVGWKKNNTEIIWDLQASCVLWQWWNQRKVPVLLVVLGSFLEPAEHTFYRYSALISSYVSESVNLSTRFNICFWVEPEIRHQMTALKKQSTIRTSLLQNYEQQMSKL